MDCVLATLLACFSWSNLYIDSGLSWQDIGDRYIERYDVSLLTDDGQLIQGARGSRLADSPQNPYGRLAIGYEIEFSQLTVRLEASHISSIATNQDRGVNAISLGARWYPFRGGR